MEPTCRGIFKLYSSYFYFQAIFKVEIHNVAGQIEFEECQEKLIFSTYFTLRVLLIITLRLLFLMILVEGYDAH